MKKVTKAEKEERINWLLDKLVFLREKCKKTKSIKLKKEFEIIKKECVSELDYLVETRTLKYKGFANYDDLCQDGRLALCMALNTYDPKKGNIYAWAHRYIKTKVKREANRHSVMKIPIKHTKTITPYKVSQLPVIVDNDPSVLDSISDDETVEIVRSAVKKLPDDQRRVIELHFEIKGRREPNTIGDICDTLGIKRVYCLKLLSEAKKTLKQELAELR